MLLPTSVVIDGAEQICSATVMLTREESFAIKNPEFSIRFRFSNNGEGKSNVIYKVREELLDLEFERFNNVDGITWSSTIGSLDDGRSVTLNVFVIAIVDTSVDSNVSRFVHVSVLAAEARDGDKI